ncbi:phosphatase PAP2 family protein [Streptomyces sp. NPDC093085]|uniref:phosphatase PAP2 family protein n=1 Tax=Streptomyces sp. NPDC093085 TaxID=3155068 RepID=UPI00343586AF
MERTAVALTAAAVVVTLLVAVRWGPLMAFDRTVAEGLHRQAVGDTGLTRVNRVFTDWVWDPWTMRLVTAVAVVALWWRRERLLAVWVIATSALGTGLSQGLKWAVGRPRPHWPDPVATAPYGAYPSGHALTATVTCGLVVWLVWRRSTARWARGTAVAVAVVSVVGVGFTRMWLGVHWSSDVLGGWLLGAALVTLSISLFRRVTLSRTP